LKEALYAQLDVAENVMMKTQKKKNEKNVLIKLVDFAHRNRIENEE
jgi:ABC-type transporter Mla maintaining outer membrane lipid asymmetry ATPase subunit MlaF